MKAELQPLNGKYYGTIISITEGDLQDNEIKIWISSDDWSRPGGGAQPSDRELIYHQISREEHERLYYSDPDSTPVDISGGHYESIATLRVATAIIKALDDLSD